ncbi:unnamed protein product [Somion occarium]|uniref:Protein-S-isoprenylcysteine O-methyltransferase n=1 Tax=Somion occarium TaxID=3059160 RepID=A0ABP1DCV6_9APHY
MQASIPFYNYFAWTSPTSTPDVCERGNYTAGVKTRECLPNFISWFVPVWKSTVFSLSLIEIYLLLCQLYPSMSNELISSYLLPTPRAHRAAHVTELTPTFVAGYLLLAAGATTRVWCYRLLGRHFTFELALRKDHKLYTKGPYAVVRHPSYTAALACVVGSAMCTFGAGSWWAECCSLDTTLGRFVLIRWIIFAGLLLVTIFTRVRKEDMVLKAAFKAEWIEWKHQTPYALWPYLY